jgi:hypothetical protein
VPPELRSVTFMEDYALNVDDTLGIVGLPTMSDDMAYVGHMANDGAAIGGLGGIDARLTVPAYVRATDARRNAAHTTIADCHTVTKATRPIAAGEELFVTCTSPRRCTSGGFARQ